MAREDGQDVVVTATRFEPLEVFKGTISSDTFSVELAGGVSGDLSSWVAGTPSFAPDSEVILFLSPLDSGADRFGLTEFGLSKFDVVADRDGRRFATRSVFSPEEDDFLAGRGGVAAARAGTRRPLRDAESFESALRSAGSGGEFPPLVYKLPEEETGPPRAAAPDWVNIGGTEGNNKLYRWFWDTGRSPAARVSAAGTQSGLTDGPDGVASVQNAAVQWSGVAGAAVLYSPSSGPAQVVVNLDVASHSSYWSEPISCTSGGIIGMGGPNAGSSAGSFKGDGNYYAVTSGNIWMRKVTGGCYPWQTFRTAVLHEVGHTLGLGHSDQAASIHSTTAPAELASAVMVSAVLPSAPSTPQADDIQAIRWLYGAGASPAPPITARPQPAPPSPSSPRLTRKL